MKRRGDRIVMITAYDAPAARIADEAGVELILVGDSAAMVMLGHESTVPVTLDEMIFLTRAVTRAARRPLVVGDLPFGTYEVSDEQAVGSAIRMVKEGGADLVKLEGAGRMVSRVRAIADSNIGVMGHIGLTPQSATKLGGFKAQGRTADAAKRLSTTRSRSQEAGAFAIVLEAVPAPVAARMTEALDDPDDRDRRGRRTATARCSSGTTCSGCTTGLTPRFVKRYAELAREIGDAVARVRGGGPRAERSRRSSTRTRSPTRSSQSSRALQVHERERATIGAPRASARAASDGPRPAVHRADAEREEHDRQAPKATASR